LFYSAIAAIETADGEKSAFGLIEEVPMSFRAAVVLVGGALVAQGLANPAMAQSQPAFEPNELLIGFRSKDERDKSARELDAVNNLVRMRGERVGGLTVKTISATSLKVRFDPPTQTRGAPSDPLADLTGYAADLKRKDTRIRYAHPNWIVPVEELPPRVPMDLTSLQGVVTTQSIPSDGGANDFTYVHGLHWHYAAPPQGMNAIAAWQLEKGSKDVVVAIIDTGILLDHPDIRSSGNLLPGYEFVRNPLLRGPDPSDPGDACPPAKPHASWHGSHVAGTVGAVGSNNARGSTGINWTVSVVPVRVFGFCGRSYVEDIADGIRWAAGLPVDNVPAEQITSTPRTSSTSVSACTGPARRTRSATSLMPSIRPGRPGPSSSLPPATMVPT
jgi:subtilisin family serine protease